MEKLTVEIELSKEELDLFNDFIEQRCVDKAKYLKRLVLKTIEGYESFLENKRAGRLKRRSVNEEAYYFGSSSRKSSLRNLANSTALS